MRKPFFSLKLIDLKPGSICASPAHCNSAQLYNGKFIPQFFEWYHFLPMRSFMKNVLAMFLMVVASAAAQARNNETRITVTYGPQTAEQRIQSLELRAQRTEMRLRELERLILNGPSYPVPEVRETLCTSKNSSNGKIFMASGVNRVDAGFNSIKACQSDAFTYSPSYCNADPTCEDVIANAPIVTCTIQQASNGKIFKGEGRNQLEAIYKTQSNCQSDPFTYSPSYCSGTAKTACSQ